MTRARLWHETAEILWQYHHRAIDGQTMRYMLKMVTMEFDGQLRFAL